MNRVRVVTIVIGVVILVTILLLGAMYRAFYQPVPLPEEIRIEALQAEIDKLKESNASAKAEIDKAKESAAKALERARLAQARAEAFSSQAAEWRGRYEVAVRERETLKRAQTGSEAIRELRQMGWVR